MRRPPFHRDRVRAELLGSVLDREHVKTIRRIGLEQFGDLILREVVPVPGKETVRHASSLDPANIGCEGPRRSHSARLPESGSQL